MGVVKMPVGHRPRRQPQLVGVAQRTVAGGVGKSGPVGPEVVVEGGGVGAVAFHGHHRGDKVVGDRPHPSEFEVGKHRSPAGDKDVVDMQVSVNDAGGLGVRPTEADPEVSDLSAQHGEVALGCIDPGGCVDRCCCIKLFGDRTKRVKRCDTGVDGSFGDRPVGGVMEAAGEVPDDLCRCRGVNEVLEFPHRDADTVCCCNHRVVSGGTDGGDIEVAQGDTNSEVSLRPVFTHTVINPVQHVMEVISEQHGSSHPDVAKPCGNGKPKVTSHRRHGPLCFINAARSVARPGRVAGERRLVHVLTLDRRPTTGTRLRSG